MSEVLDRPNTVATKRMVVFENPGEIDITAISTFGVSVKEGDNPIGFFGTGLKYALAILLRNGHDVTVWSGTTRIDFGTEPVTVRGQQFDIVHMNGEKLGFTTQVGKTWELWMAYRELFCNARDENGDTYASRTLPVPVPGHTFIAVSSDDFASIHDERWKYFVEGEPDLVVSSLHVWERESVAYFYRGVRVQEYPRQALFTYNDTQELELTEDRTVKHGYQTTYRIAQAMMTSADEIMLRKVLVAPDQWLEHHLDFHAWGFTPSPTFLRVVGSMVNDGLTNVNATARKVWEQRQPREFKPREIELTAVQRKTLDKALAFCGKIGLPVEGAYPIHVVESLGTNTLGLAKGGRIYVSERAFHMGGTKQVASVLIEEYVHLRHSYEDCTRPMQNWLFEKMVSLGEEITGEPL